MSNLYLISRFHAFASLLVLSILLPISAQSQNPSQPSRLAPPIQAFKVSKNLTDLREYVQEATLLELDANAAYWLWSNAPETFALELPNVYGEALILELGKVDILAPGFKVGALGTQAQDALPYQSGVHYQGTLRDDPTAVVALSVFPNSMMGLVADGSGNHVIGKLEDGSDRYLLYRSADLTMKNPAQCFADLVADEAVDVEVGAEDRGGACGGSVQIYFECDYKLFTDKNSDETEVTNYVTGLFNQVAALYAAEQVNVSIAEIKIWNSPDPYTVYSSTSSVLSAFRNGLGTSFSGNLAHFLTSRNLGGGIAFLDVICAKSSAFGVSAIKTTYQSIPTYSWTVEVVTHELGHNLGSWHTQSCNWPSGPIDNCYGQEGSCQPGPTPTNGGTIMSYCHLTSIGINLANGFGPLPGDRIRARVAAATCLSGSGGSAVPTGLQSTNISANGATLSWASGGSGSSYTVQYRKLGVTTWQTSSALSTVTYTLSGLDPSTQYEWQVKNACSAYSAIARFTTGAGSSSCAAPSNLTVSNLAAASVQCNWGAVQGASQYTVEYKLSTATTWTSAGTTAQTNYLLSGLVSSKAYDWRVKASCSAFSASATFTTLQSSGGGGVPTCARPTGLSVVILSSTSARLSWSPVTGASNYTLQIRRKGTVTWFTLGTVAVTSVRIMGLTPNQPYEWRIKANCSIWTDPVPLQSPGFTYEPGNAPALSDEKVLAYPNPTTGMLLLDRGLRTETATGEAILYDATGRQVLRQTLQGEQASLDLGHLPAGVYHLQLWEMEQRVASQKVVKM